MTVARKTTKKRFKTLKQTRRAKKNVVEKIQKSLKKRAKDKRTAAQRRATVEIKWIGKTIEYQ